MSKKQYAKCEEYWKNVEKLPEFDTLVKASRLLSNGGYWGPEAEENIQPEDINVDALKIQMKLFLQEYDENLDRDSISEDDFQSLVERVMATLRERSSPHAVEPRETLLSAKRESIVCYIIR